MGPTWGPPGSCRPQVGLMLAPRTLLSGYLHALQPTFRCPLNVVQYHSIQHWSVHYMWDINQIFYLRSIYGVSILTIRETTDCVITALYGRWLCDGVINYLNGVITFVFVESCFIDPFYCVSNLSQILIWVTVSRKIKSLMQRSFLYNKYMKTKTIMTLLTM